MHGLDIIHRLNDQEAARFLRKRYEKLLGRAIRRKDWGRAQRYDREVADLGRYIRNEIPVFPNQKNRTKKLYVPSLGRDFSKLDRS